jgi:hypothetical protein
MLDTLHLCLTDFRIDSDAQLLVRPSDVDLSRGEKLRDFLLWDDGESEVRGRKAFHNSHKLNFDVEGFPSDKGTTISAMVGFSVPKIISGHNYEPADYKTTSEAVIVVQQYLRDLGVHTNLKDATLSRVDACRTLKVDEPYLCYQHCFQRLKGTRVQPREYPTSYLWSNTRQEISMYDKILEMKNNRHDITGFHPNSLRAELRWKKAQKIQEVTQMKTLRDLLQNMDHVKSCYNTAMQKQIFKRDLDGVYVMSVEGIKEELLYFKAQGSRFYFTNWLRAVAMQRGIGDFDAAVQAVQEVAGNRMTASRHKKALEEYRLEADRLELFAPSRRNIGELYSELRTKVLA